MTEASRWLSAELTFAGLWGFPTESSPSPRSSRPRRVPIAVTMMEKPLPGHNPAPADTVPKPMRPDPCVDSSHITAFTEAYPGSFATKPLGAQSRLDFEVLACVSRRSTPISSRKQGPPGFNSINLPTAAMSPDMNQDQQVQGRIHRCKSCDRVFARAEHLRRHCLSRASPQVPKYLLSLLTLCL